jgi:hypothetical protein
MPKIEFINEYSIRKNTTLGFIECQGYYSFDLHTCYVCSDRPIGEVLATLIHEFGHALEQPERHMGEQYPCFLSCTLLYKAIIRLKMLILYRRENED